MRPIEVRNDVLPVPVTLDDGERWAVIHALRDRILFLRQTIATWEASPFEIVKRGTESAKRSLRDTVAALDVFAQSDLEKEF